MRPLIYKDGILRLLDQTMLPGQVVWVECRTCEQVADAIKGMVVRGAPAIGVTAAYGMAISASGIASGNIGPKEPIKDRDTERGIFLTELDKSASLLKSTRPTAVNLAWAVDRMLSKARECLDNGKSIRETAEALIAEAFGMDLADVESNRKIGRYGCELINNGDTILTHCNAGSLACCDYGTALGVVRAAHEAGKKIKVFADETRPYLQGARLTAYELKEDGIPVTLICDNMAGWFMRKGEISCCVVGADRIAQNGDTANKIGTYSAAVLAKENRIPFYVAAPVSTIDADMADGDGIPIEERDANEVTHFRGIRTTPEGISVRNPAFDITPAGYITAIITDAGILRPPYSRSIKQALSSRG